ncbi:MAG: cache domain-containing protein [Desulfosarcina sp.]|nr:cache domain-containing protein [Desulfosarcina sp.]
MNTPKLSISRTFLIHMALVGVISVFSIGYLWVTSEWSRFEKEANSLRASYLESQKITLKREVNQALNFVNFMKSQTENRLQESIKGRVEEAYAIIENIYLKERDNKSTEEIEALIKQALRSLRYNNGRGYYFAFTLEGVETLFEIRPEMEGTNMLQVRGGEGEFVVSDMLAVIREDGEGFYKYTWPKPNQQGFFPRVAFVKLFKPIGWVIGSGEYLDYVEKDIQEECLKWISNIEFEKDSYVFAGKWDGLVLSGPETGNNVYDIVDINGVKIVQELIQLAKEGGGFVEHVIPRFEGKKHTPKISYAAGVPEWQWYISAGLYVDEIDTALALKQSELERRIRTNIRNIALILFALLILIFLIVKLLSDQIHHNVKLFKNFFKKASTDAIKIEGNAIYFYDFAQLAESANDMVENRIQTEKALRESEEKFRMLVEQSPLGISLIGEDGRYKYLNPRFVKMFGYTIDDVTTGIEWFNNAFPDDRYRQKVMKAWSDYQRHPQTKRSRAHVYTVTCKDGSQKEINFRPLNIKKQGQLVIYEDITERSRLEQQLWQAQKMEAIGTLAGGIAHNFNNLMMGIQGRASLMTLELGPSHPQQEHIQAIEEQIVSASALTRQLLGLARGGKYEVKPIDLNELLLSSASIIGRTRKDIQIHSKLFPSSLVVEADKRQIEQVFLNIFVNSIQAMPDGGEIYLETTILNLKAAFCKPYAAMPGRYVKISVKDTGVGMNKETCQQVFDPFFTTKDKYLGTGLGLASAYGIIKNHGGVITVSSDLGRGTTISLYLPVSEKTAHKDDAHVDDMIIRGSGTILLVDDEDIMIDVGKPMLENLGYRVIVAKGGENAVDAVSETGNNIDLVILDLIMPGMDGSGTFDAIREIYPKMPIILSSGYSLKGKATDIMQRGCNAFIQKPFNISELSQLIRKVLDLG